MTTTETFDTTVSHDVGLLSKQDIIETVEHAITVAREASHTANGGAWSDCTRPADFDERSKLTAHGRQRRDLWWSVFFGIVSHEQFDSHRPR